MRSPNSSYIRRDTTNLHCSPTGWTPCVTELPDGSLFAVSSEEWVSIALNSPLNGSFYITIEKENTLASTNMQESPLFPLCPFWFCTCNWDRLEQTYFLVILFISLWNVDIPYIPDKAVQDQRRGPMWTFLILLYYSFLILVIFLQRI